MSEQEYVVQSASCAQGRSECPEGALRCGGCVGNSRRLMADTAIPVKARQVWGWNSNMRAPLTTEPTGKRNVVWVEAPTSLSPQSPKENER